MLLKSITYLVIVSAFLIKQYFRSYIYIEDATLPVYVPENEIFVNNILKTGST